MTGLSPSRRAAIPFSALLALGLLPGLAACGVDLRDTRYDHGLDFHSLTEMEAQVWVDPDGCDHWIIDDGSESYMTPRVHPDGRPVCRAGAVPEGIYNIVKP
jgi:hypothetical protein